MKRLSAPRGKRSGRSRLLMVDAGASDAFWPRDFKWALRTAEMLADYGVAWFEEPLPPDALNDYVPYDEQRVYRSPAAKC